MIVLLTRNCVPWHVGIVRYAQRWGRGRGAEDTASPSSKRVTVELARESAELTPPCSARLRFLLAFCLSSMPAVYSICARLSR